jgi:hypothetical protein
MPVTYVIGDVAGVIESPVYAIQKMNEAGSRLDDEAVTAGTGDARSSTPPCRSPMHAAAMKWDGEWHITIEVFRDLGMAFAACWS